MEGLSEFLTTASQVLQLFRQGKELLPDGIEKDNAEQALLKAETSLKVTEAQLAQAMGYQLCQCSWPPNIMLYKRDLDEYQCPVCGSGITSVKLRRNQRGK